MVKNKFLFYFLSFTWGLPMTLIGLFAGLSLYIIGCRPTKHGYCVRFRVGKGWGGVSFGAVFITCHDAYQHTMDHEHGHSHQNCIWGPLFPFVIAIPSAIRYWYRVWVIKTGRKTWLELPSYDSAWYEGGATRIGTEFMNWYNTK